MVSTDHAEHRKAAEAAGIAAPFVRPEAISGDRISDYEVLIHAWKRRKTLTAGATTSS